MSETPPSLSHLHSHDPGSASHDPFPPFDDSSLIVSSPYPLHIYDLFDSKEDHDIDTSDPLNPHVITLLVADSSQHTMADIKQQVS